MVLFVADSHLGRSDRHTESLVEGDLIACLRSLADDLTSIYLVGDLFEHYIEYKHLVPKGFVRLQGLLADLADAGMPITYIVGNHDPWHRDYFEDELGVRIEMNDCREVHFGKAVYVHHGDGVGGASTTYRLLRPILRHPFPVWIYRSLLPADLGMRLAAWYSTLFHDEHISDSNVRGLREHAKLLLANTENDVAVFAHTHRAELCNWECGTYLNPGCWFTDRTLGLMDASGVRLARWDGQKLEPVST